MHYEAQISSRGEWGDASIVEDNKGRLNYCCQYCKFKCRAIISIKNHLIKCIENNSKLIEGIDFVICKICNFHAQNLGIHLSKIHKIKSENYKKKYNCNTTSKKSNKKYSENTFRYLSDAKEKGIDLTEYWQKVSKGVSNAILSNSKEIKRRSEMMKLLNDKQQSDPVFKKIVSDTAKLTSSRPEILEKRTYQLKKWRDNNPELFKNICIYSMLNSWQSKPEKKLFEFVKLLDGFDFKKNQRIKSKLFVSSTKEKQIDIADKSKRIYIEFDGIFHFKDIFKKNVLLDINIKDKLLDEHIFNHNWTLIRVSYDQFIYKTKIINKIKIDSSYFKQECLDEIIRLLQNNIPGVYKIGAAYGKY